MWVPPSPHPYPRLWFFETHIKRFYFLIKMGWGIKANRGVIISEKPMYWHDDKLNMPSYWSLYPSWRCLHSVDEDTAQMGLQLWLWGLIGMVIRIHFLLLVLSWDTFTPKVLPTQLQKCDDRGYWSIVLLDLAKWDLGLGFPSDSAVKNLPAMQETQVQSLGQTRFSPLE